MKDFDGQLDRLGKGCFDALPETSKSIMKRRKQSAKEMLAEPRVYQEGSEERLYKRWQEPLDLLECLIGLSMEYAKNTRINLLKLLIKRAEPNLQL
jgi:hypothetical protein